MIESIHVKAAIRMAHASAGGSCLPEQSALEVLEELRNLVPYAGALITVRSHDTGGHRTLMAVGYDMEMVNALNSTAYISDPKWRILQKGKYPLRWQDVPGSRETSLFYQTYLKPRGYMEGVTVPIYDKDGLYVGMLALNTESIRFPTDSVVQALSYVSPTLVSLVQRLSHAPKTAIRLDGAGALISHAADALPPPNVLLHARRFIEAGNVPVKFLDWDRTNTTPLQIQVYPSDFGDEFIATWRTTNIPFGLSRREIDILSGLSFGMSNRDIASLFVISERTVSTHVERILKKMGVLNRSAAVSLALQNGAFLPK